MGMLKKTITFKDLDGNPVTEDFYFNISRAEATKRAMVMGDPFLERLKRLNAEKDGQLIIDTFEDILRSAVGRRHENNRQFVKSPEISDYFMQSGAYDTFFMELISSPDSGAEFVRGILPSAAEIDEITKQAEAAAAARGIKPEEPPSLTVIEGVAGDAAAQAAKPQPVFQSPEQLHEQHQVTDTQVATDRLTSALTPTQPAQQGTEDDPAWFREGRNPTRQELMRMNKEEMLFAAKMREAGLIK